MTESSPAVDQESERYPLSLTQEWFITLYQGDEGGTFGPRFMLVSASRTAGRWACRRRSGGRSGTPACTCWMSGSAWSRREWPGNCI